MVSTFHVRAKALWHSPLLFMICRGQFEYHLLQNGWKYIYNTCIFKCLFFSWPSLRTGTKEYLKLS